MSEHETFGASFGGHTSRRAWAGSNLCGVLMVLVVSSLVTACGPQRSRKPVPKRHEAAVMTIDGVDGTGPRSTEARQQLERSARFDIVAWRDGRLHAFLAHQAGIPTRGQVQELLGEGFAIVSFEISRQGPRFGTASGTKSGPR